jgi:glucose-6-phosphate 1-epimerase
MTSDHPAIELPPSVVLQRGEGCLPCVRVAGRAGRAEIYLQGAHVTSWRPTGWEPVIWLSRFSTFSPGAPIRGGIPVCFPWFGRNLSDPDAPLHGFARLHNWTLVAASEDGDDVSLTFQLSDSDDTRSSAWPFRFEATYRVVVGMTLQLSLEITNPGSEPVAFEEALHTYYAVGDVRDVGVLGLTGASYLDRVADGEPVRQRDEPIRIEQETDRLYLSSAETVTIEDAAGDRVIRIRKGGSNATLVWNPWIDKSEAMSDFGGDEWIETICVETCNAGPTGVMLGPGERHRMTTTIDLLSLVSR